ncbi:MAG: CBS domain-containing protein [Candidatus Azotimanducaceae bacterium]|jgi:CBS domain-containing protein
MLRVKHLLADKEAAVWSIGPSQSVYQAIEMMALKSVGALTVLNDAGELVGIISERDYARKVILNGKSSKDTQVDAIMTRKLTTIGANARIEECLALMTEKHIRHLPVLDAEQLVGMISVGDLVKSIISEQDHKIEQLERYVRGEEAGSLPPET